MKKMPDSLSDHLERGNLMAASCPSRAVLRATTSQWGVLVLMVLRDGTHRFSELRRRIGGVSERMLSETLKRLESYGMITRTAYPVVPPVTEYALTDTGREAAIHVAALADWIEINLSRIIPAADAQSSLERE